MSAQTPVTLLLLLLFALAAATALADEELDWLVSDMVAEQCRTVVARKQPEDGKQALRLCDWLETESDDLYHAAASQFASLTNDRGMAELQALGTREPHRSELRSAMAECTERIINLQHHTKLQLVRRSLEDCFMAWWMNVYTTHASTLTRTASSHDPDSAAVNSATPSWLASLLNAWGGVDPAWQLRLVGVGAVLVVILVLAAGSALWSVTAEQHSRRASTAASPRHKKD